MLTFEGTINENASGELTITGAYGQFRDANGHNCNFPWTASSTKKLGVSLDKTVDFPITYDLAGGTLETANPSSYNYYSEAITLNNPTRKGYTFSGWTGSNGVTASTTVTIPKNSSGAKYYVANWSPIKYSITYDYGFNQTAVSNKTSYTIETATFTLNNPTRQGHRFEGWTGTGLTAVTKTVTIETGSTGDRSFTANWSPIWEGKGTKEDPWIITTTEGLDSLAKNVNQGRSFYGNYIQLGANITYTHGSGTDENNYTAIGGYHNGAVRKFYGIFDGKGYCVSGIRIHKTGDEEADKYQGLFGAVAGASGSVKNVVLDDAKIYGNTNVGGIAGYGEEKFHIENCLVFNTTVTATGNNGLCGAIISEISSSSGNLTIKYNYYRGCTVGGQTTNIGIGSGDYSTNDGAVEGYTITFGTDISGTPKSIIKHNGSDYYSVGTTISFSYAGELSDGQSAFYFVDGTPIAGNSYTMTAKDVTVSMSIASTNTVMLAGHPSGGRYWATFYGFFNYQLPADASAYKLSSDEELYRVVSNGGILPAFSPVVIVSESSTIQLSYTTTAATIDNTGNILVGALSDVSVSGGLIEGKTPYVLGVYGEFSLLGFYKFSGNSIPANKAYYLK